MKIDWTKIIPKAMKNNMSKEVRELREYIEKLERENIDLKKDNETKGRIIEDQNKEIDEQFCTIMEMKKAK